MEGVKTEHGIFMVDGGFFGPSGRCPDNEASITAATMQYELDHFSDEFHEIDARTRCLSAYSDVVRTGVDNDLQLSYFAQNHTGRDCLQERSQ